MEHRILYTWNRGAALAYEVVGDGPTDLIYMPGVGSNLEWNWRHPAYARYLQRLASFCRLIVVDRRGWGCSDRFGPGEIPDLDDMVDDLVAVREAAAGKPPALMAVNEAGWLAIAAAAARPDSFSRLLLFGCSPVGSRTADMPWEMTRERLEVSYKSIERMTDAREWVRTFIRDNNPSLIGDADAEEWLSSLFRLTAGPGSAATEVRSWADIDLRDRLAAISMPTLVMSRPSAPYWPVESSRYLSEHIVNSELIELDGADAYPWLGDWKVVTEHIKRFIAGAEVEAMSERRVTTVLFTDIVGSSSLAEELGDRSWRDLIDDHNATVRTLLARHRGRELDTAGDGFFANFDSPGRAIACGLDIVDATRRLGLGVRVGVHTGECEVVDGKIAGVAVVIGARIAGLAQPGEVLVSDTVRQLVSGSAVMFADRGRHSLKGLAVDWQLFAVVPR